MHLSGWCRRRMGAFPMAEEPGQENRDAPSNEDKPSRRRLIGLAIAGAILGAILLVVFLWVWVHPTDPTEKKDFIQAVGVLLAALAALGGLYFTRASTKDQLEQARDNTEQQLQQARESTRDQLKQAHESQVQTQRLTEQGQITDRFTRAIEYLGATDDEGNPQLEIRLGGIYALERIAWDSPERDHSTVMAVLTAYVRENSLRPPPPPPFDPRHPTADIQAILDVLSRAQTRVSEEYRTRLDLRGADLRGANLQGANLQEANLQETNFQEVNLQGANVTQEQLADTWSLQGATMPDGQILKGILGLDDRPTFEEWRKGL